MISFCKNCGGEYVNYSDPGETPIMVHPENGCKHGEPIQEPPWLAEMLHHAWLEGFEAGRNNPVTPLEENMKTENDKWPEQLGVLIGKVLAGQGMTQQTLNLLKLTSDSKLIVDYINGLLSTTRLEERKKLVGEIREKLPKEKKLDDVYTEEEKQLLSAIGMPNRRTPEYLRERRHGYNQALQEVNEILNQISNE